MAEKGHCDVGILSVSERGVARAFWFAAKPFSIMICIVVSLKMFQFHTQRGPFRKDSCAQALP